MTTMFTQITANRIKKMVLRMSIEEQEYLRLEAKRRNIHIQTLVRDCLRKSLRPDKQEKSDAAQTQDTNKLSG